MSDCFTNVKGNWLLECINTSVWNLFIIPEEDWSQSKSIEEYEVNKLNKRCL